MGQQAPAGARQVGQAPRAEPVEDPVERAARVNAAGELEGMMLRWARCVGGDDVFREAQGFLRREEVDRRGGRRFEADRYFREALNERHNGQDWIYVTPLISGCHSMSREVRVSCP